jgi:hypothetical protein
LYAVRVLCGVEGKFSRHPDRIKGREYKRLSPKTTNIWTKIYFQRSPEKNKHKKKFFQFEHFRKIVVNIAIKKE